MEENIDRRRKTLSIKLFPIDCLMGSIRYQLDADERGVWYDLILLSALCRYPGFISDKDSRPFPHQYIASRLNVSLELLERTLAKCGEEGRIKENATGIEIVNWKVYQSEYLRQKPYREAKKDREAELQEEYDDPDSIGGHSLESIKAILTGGDPVKAKDIPERTKQLWRKELKRRGISL